MRATKQAMADLETCDTIPGAAILSIGAVFFDLDGLGHEFYTPVRLSSCKTARLSISADTMAWWSRQSPQARELLDIVQRRSTPSLTDALQMLRAFLGKQTDVKLWGNGADFDNPILAVAHHRVKLKQCWNAYNGRCYRTVKNIAPGPKLVRSGTHHNALDDAKSQALHMIELFKLHPTLVLE